MSRVEMASRPELTPLPSQGKSWFALPLKSTTRLTISTENALAAYTKTPPRSIKIDPKSARTVIHEVHAHHRGPPRSESSWEDDFPRGPPKINVNRGDRDRKAGILPDRHHYTPPRRSKSRHQRRNYGTDSDSDSDSDGYLKAPVSRRRRSNSDRSRSSRGSHASNRPPLGRRHSSELARYDDRRDLVVVPKPQSRSSLHDADTDSGYDSEAHEREKRAARNKKILYTGLAGLTTLTAANGIYQNTKAFHGRRNAMKEAAENGELQDEEERRKQRNKHLMMDAFALLVVGVGVNNVRVGWQRREEKKKAHEVAEQKAFERFERRERGMGRERAYGVEER